MRDVDCPSVASHLPLILYRSWGVSMLCQSIAMKAANALAMLFDVINMIEITNKQCAVRIN